MNRALESRLYDACMVLFGPEVDVNRDFLLYIQPSGIKSAYRRKALMTHPDRLGAKGERGGSDGFIEAHRAYRTLIDFARSRQDGGQRLRRRAHSQRAARRRPGQAPRSHFHTGRVPERVLPLGQFLFYSGRISWEDLIGAITWQRRSRPRMGEIARGWGLLTDIQLYWLFSRKEPGEFIGEAAVRLGLLKEHQVGTLLFKQKRLQRPFGEYFVKRGIVGTDELERILGLFAEHNATIRNHLRRGQGRRA